MATNQKSINDYNYYDRGYSTGSQTSIFVGPIWVEEALSINIRSTTNDVPIYPYSSEYFNRLMLGRYIVTGTFAIPFIKPNYLLSIIQQASSTQLSQAELKSMISERTNMFTQTVAAQIEAKFNDPATVSKSEIAKYARRISRELEVVSKGFDLTIVQGDIYGETSSIEIYENVKITDVQKAVLNDDETVVELYSFTAQRMPDRKKPVTQEIPNASRYVLKDDVLASAKQIVKDIVHEAFSYPEIRVITPKRRSGLVFNTDKIGITGPLNESSRSFGKSASFQELVYSYKYPLSYNLLSPITTIADGDLTEHSNNTSISTNRKNRYRFPIWRKTDSDVKAFIEGYADPVVTNITNTQGNIVSLDRTLSAKYVCATAQIEPVPESVPVKGGTILVKRTKSTDAGVASFVPPVYITDNSKFTCADTQLDGLRYGVMWNTTIGCRSSGKSDLVDTSTDDKCIRDIGRPLLSISYYSKTDIESISEGKGWRYKISAPVYLDYVDLNVSTDGCGKSKQPLLKDDWKDQVFTIASTDSTSITVDQPDSGTITVMTGGTWSTDKSMGPVLSVYYDNITLGEPYPSIAVEKPSMLDFVPDNIMRYLSKFHYKFFEITIPLVGKCGIDLSKSLNIQPYVFLRGTDGKSTVFKDDMVHSKDQMVVMPAVAKKFTDNDNTDDACKIDFWFDWTVSSIDGDIGAQSVTIHGLYYAHKKDATTTGKVIADVAFVATVLPMMDMCPKKNKTEQPNIVTDIKQNGGQYTELYSFVRCDVPSYYSVPMYHTDTMEAIDVLKGSWIQNTPWSYTPVWDHMGGSSEVEYQYELYKKMLPNMLKHAASVLPDVALNKDKLFDINKDIPCLCTIIRNSMSPIAGFVRGFGFSLSPKGIYNALTSITFTGSDLAGINVFKTSPLSSSTEVSASSESDLPAISFGNAIKTCGLEKTIVREIRKIILDEANLAGYSISDDPLNSLQSTDITDNTPIFIETQVVTPAQDIVRSGFTSDGYKVLMGISDEDTSSSSKILKGITI